MRRAESWHLNIALPQAITEQSLWGAIVRRVDCAAWMWSAAWRQQIVWMLRGKMLRGKRSPGQNAAAVWRSWHRKLLAGDKVRLVRRIAAGAISFQMDLTTRISSDGC